MNAIRKCRKSPNAAVFAPPWNDLGPSNPEATDWKIRIGGKWFWIPHAMHAWLISRTPHASPPQKMARKALEDVEEAVDATETEGMSTPFENDQNLRQHSVLDAPDWESSIAHLSWLRE
jgi:hypothetical protein